MCYNQVLLLCVGVLCIESAAGSYHLLHKRQSGTDVCNAVLADNICTSGYYEDYAYLAAQCFQRETAEMFQGACSTNSDGIRCATFDVYSGDVDNVCGSSPTTCSTECRALLTTMHAQLGCCVNALNDSSSDNPGPFRYSLWSLCGMEAVTEECTPSFDVPTNIETPCNPLTIAEQLYTHVLCRTEFIDSLRGALNAAGCENLPSDDYSCAVYQGRYCAAGPSVYDLLDTATSSCTNTSVCEPGCMQTLTNIISTVGCCFTSQFNGTTPDVTYDFLSYEFWQLCGLTSPGLCEQRFDDSPFRISNPNGTTTDGGDTDGGSPSSAAATRASATAIGFAVVTFTTARCFDLF